MPVFLIALVLLEPRLERCFMKCSYHSLPPRTRGIFTPLIILPSRCQNSTITTSIIAKRLYIVLKVHKLELSVETLLTTIERFMFRFNAPDIVEGLCSRDHFGKNEANS